MRPERTPTQRRPPMPPADDAPSGLLGRILRDTYRVEWLQAQGGMGTVYGARNLVTEGMFALKVLRREATRDPGLFSRFYQEARVTSALRSPAIVQVVDLFSLDDGRPCILMEYVEGEDLGRRLKRDERVPLEEALGICREVGRALHAAHKLGVIHRDLKPSNVLLQRVDHGDQLGCQPKLIDFGVCRVRGSQYTPAEQVLGTLDYLSPEGALGYNEDLDGRSDQYALALILYRMLAGALPGDFVQRGRSDSRETFTSVGLPPDVPPRIVIAIERALSWHKEQRFDTMLQFVSALAGESVVSLPVAAPPAPEPPPPPPAQARPPLGPPRAIAARSPVRAERSDVTLLRPAEERHDATDEIDLPPGWDVDLD